MDLDDGIGPFSSLQESIENLVLTRTQTLHVLYHKHSDEMPHHVTGMSVMAKNSPSITYDLHDLTIGMYLFMYHVSAHIMQPIVLPFTLYQQPASSAVLVIRHYSIDHFM